MTFKGLIGHFKTWPPVHLVFSKFRPLDHIFQYHNVTPLLFSLKRPFIWYITQACTSDIDITDFKMADSVPPVHLVFSTFRPLDQIFLYHNVTQLLSTLKRPFRWYITQACTIDIDLTDFKMAESVPPVHFFL